MFLALVLVRDAIWPTLSTTESWPWVCVLARASPVGVVCARCARPQRRGMGALLSAAGGVVGSGDLWLPPPLTVPLRDTRGTYWTAGALCTLRAQRASLGIVAVAALVVVQMGGRLQGVQSASLPERSGEQSSTASPQRLGHLGQDGALRASPLADPSRGCGGGGGAVSCRGAPGVGELPKGRAGCWGLGGVCASIQGTCVLGGSIQQPPGGRRASAVHTHEAFVGISIHGLCSTWGCIPTLPRRISLGVGYEAILMGGGGYDKEGGAGPGADIHGAC